MFSHTEIITCPTCKQEKDYYVDNDGYCIYESKCQCDKQRVNKKKIDEALRLVGELLKTGEFYVKS
jgi:hypothetical protein